MIEKLTTADRAMRPVRDGDVVGLQSGPTQCAPMALVRELIRGGARDLHIVTLSGGIALDWLVAAGGVGRVTFAAATMEHFGMCHRFRRAVEAGAVGVEELSETALLAQLGAAARGLPFLPTTGMIGTELWDWVADERLRTFCAGAAQIDAHGNANNSVIGSFDRPRVRLPGTAGPGDMGSLSKRIVYWVTDHSPRTLVERVDFRSAAGYLDGGGERARLGLGGGPELVVTNLAVLDFAPVSERMRLRSVHPGVTVEQVLAATGFEPVRPAEVAATAVPTVRQVNLIRRVIDPEGYRRRGFRPPA